MAEIQIRLRLKPALVCLVALFTCVSCGGSDNAVDMTLQVDQTVFRSGDPISLTVVMRARSNTRVYLGEKPSETLKLFLQGGDGQTSDRNDTTYWYSESPLLEPEVGIPIELTEGETRTITIDGVVTVDRDTGETEFDFGDFGTAIKDAKYRSFLIGVGFWPTKWESSDLLIHFTNDVWIDVEK